FQSAVAGGPRDHRQAAAARHRTGIRSRRAGGACGGPLRACVSGGRRLMRARVFVTLKPSVFDPQGTTVAEALHTLGYATVRDVRQGKYFELEIDAPSADEARRLASEAADKLLSNPVIESYRIEVTSRNSPSSSFP